MAGLLRKKGYFPEEGINRQLQDFEQDVDDSLRALSKDLEAVKATTKTTLEKNEAAIEATTQVANRASANTSSLDARVTQNEADILVLQTPEHIRGKFTTSFSGVQFNVVTNTASRTEGSISTDGSFITVGVDGLYQIDFFLTIQSSSTSNPFNHIIEIRCEENGGGSITLGTFRQVRFNTSTSTFLTVSGGASVRLLASDRIWFRFGSTGTTTTAASAALNGFTVTKVSE